MGQLVLVSKSRGGAAYLRRTNIARSKKPVRPSVLEQARALPKRHPSQVTLAGAGALATGGVASQAPALERRRSPEQRRRADTAAGAAVGGAAGHAAYLGVGFKLRAQGHKTERLRPEGMSRSAHQKIMRDHHRKMGVSQNTKPNKLRQAPFYRNYPEGLPATKYKRALGQMSGGRGKLLHAAAIGTTGMVGAGVARGRKEPVRKALYQREERLSPARVAGLAAGGALAMYGLGHSKMVGSAIARGVKMAQRGQYDGVADALRRADAARGSIRQGMAPGEAAIRRIQAMNSAIERVPAPIRPEVALVAGTMLANRSTPVRRTNYRQVSYPVYR